MNEHGHGVPTSDGETAPTGWTDSVTVEATSFDLRNEGAGPDELSLSDLAARSEGVALFLHRDYRCGHCREQVQAVDARREAFAARETVPVSVVPEPANRVADWVETYDLSYPVLSDAEGAVASAYEQPRRYGFLGRLHDLLGRLPAVVLVDTRGDGPRVDRAYRGGSAGDRPTVDEVLAAVDEQRQSFLFDCSLVDC
jgi:peroxiredoxin Q/BCP